MRLSHAQPAGPLSSTSRRPPFTTLAAVVYLEGVSMGIDHRVEGMVGGEEREEGGRAGFDVQQPGEAGGISCIVKVRPGTGVKNAATHRTYFFV